MLFEEHAQEGETEDGLAVSVGRQVGAGTKHVGRVPKIVFEILEIRVCHIGRGLMAVFVCLFNTSTKIRQKIEDW